MAGESKIAVTEGSGKNVHTWQRLISAVNVEEDVAIIGEPYLASYIATTGGVTAANAGDDDIQLMAGAALNVRIRRIRMEQTALITAALITTFTVIRLTSAGTGGAAITPSKKDNGDAAAGATAASAVPTATHGTAGVTLLTRTFMPIQTSPVGGLSLIPYWEWVEAPNTKPIIIPAGATNGIAVRNLSARAGLTVNVEIEFDESSFVL